MSIIFLISLVALGAISGFTSEMQRVTLNLGKFMARGNEFAPRRGFQDAITPKSQSISNYLLFVLIGLILLGFFVFDWYIPIIGFVLYSATSYFISNLTSNKLAVYIGKITTNLARRSADYAKKGDTERSEAAKDLSAMVIESYEELSSILGNDITVDQLVDFISEK